MGIRVQGNPVATGPHRIQGLDSIRLVCAAIVALGHFGKQIRETIFALAGNHVGEWIAAPVGIAFNGPAAVIAFFVLSGFVVHLPKAEGRPFGTTEYFARRYLRIVPPALAALALYIVLDIPQARTTPWGTLLWSILCELIYYTLYPLLLRSRVPMGWAFAAALALSIVLVVVSPAAIQPSKGLYMALGPGLTWLLGLPCWLAGCWLAERYRRFPEVRTTTLWAARFTIWAVSAVLMAVRFHLPWMGPLLSVQVLLNFYAIPVALWLGLEARQFHATPPPLDAPGRASYSLYLSHPLALLVFDTWAFGVAAVPLYLVLVAAFTALFYLAIERPSHRAAQRLGRKLRADRSGI